MNKSYIDFLLGDLFDIYSPKKRFNANNISFGGKFPYVARSSTNNGIRGYITEDTSYLNPANSLSFGQDTATVFYQPNAYFTGDKIKVMVLKKHNLNEKLAQYFITTISKSFSLFTWGQNSFSEDVIKNTKIKLPVIESHDLNHQYTVDDIDWQYMHDRITELEHDRITELDTYLKVTGLNNYNFTKEDKKILSPDPSLKFKEFTLDELFEVSKGDVDLQKKDLNGKGHFLVNSGIDNIGIKGKTDRPARIFLPNTITIDFWGNAYYRDYEYKLATHNHVFSLSGDVIKNKAVGLYLVSLLSRLPQLFSFSNMATWDKLKGIRIKLPITSDNKINFDYMERYIRAVEKLVIADVVKYKDKVIETTKKIVTSKQ